MSEHIKLSKEETKARVKAYKAAKKAAQAKARAEEKERAAQLKALSPEEKKKRSEEAKAEAEATKKAAKEKVAKAKAERVAEKKLLASMSKDEREAYLAKKAAAKKVYVDTEFAKYKAHHAEVVAKKMDELNARYDTGGNIHRFWFKVGQSRFCQGYMNWWRKLEIRNPTLAKWLYQIFYFLVFSNGVTLWQYLVLTFLPYLFGIGLAGTAFMWPQNIVLGYYNGNPIYWSVLGYAVQTKNGVPVIGGGLGYFLAFEIAVFTAQCINFPLQRNITFRSHGNPWWQGMWYFIGWVAISFACNMINALWLPFAQLYLSMPVYNILNMIATGGISMVIFFFIFKLIFPAGEAKKE